MQIGNSLFLERKTPVRIHWWSFAAGAAVPRRFLGQRRKSPERYSYVSEWGWCTNCMFFLNQCFDPGKVFFGRCVDIQTSGRCGSSKWRCGKSWCDPLSVYAPRSTKKINTAPKWENLLNFGPSNLEIHADIHEFYIQHLTFLGSNPLCLISPHFLPRHSSPNSRQFDEGNAQKRQDAEYETRLERETHEILLSQLK